MKDMGFFNDNKMQDNSTEAEDKSQSKTRSATIKEMLGRRLSLKEVQELKVGDSFIVQCHFSDDEESFNRSLVSITTEGYVYTCKNIDFWENYIGKSDYLCEYFDLPADKNFTCYSCSYVNKCSYWCKFRNNEESEVYLTVNDSASRPAEPIKEKDANRESASVLPKVIVNTENSLTKLLEQALLLSKSMPFSVSDSSLKKLDYYETDFLIDFLESYKKRNSIRELVFDFRGLLEKLKSFSESPELIEKYIDNNFIE